MRRTVDFPIGFALEVTLSALKTVSEAIRDRLPSVLATDRLKVDGSGVTQPISGTVAISGTPTISGAVTVTSGSVTAAQGTAAAAGAPWFVRLSDGAAAIAVALDSTVLAMSAKLPAALGITTSALSLSVAPASDALFDVSSRAARLIGALTGADGATIATNINGVPVVRTTPKLDQQITLATAGKLIQSGPTMVYGLTSYFNNTGGAIFFQVHNGVSLPVPGARPAAFSVSIASAAKNSLGFGITALGVGCPDGAVFVASSTQDTYTAIASTNVIYALQYD